jgi:general secretion pathway protein J
MSKDAGFTLLELLVAITLLAFLSVGLVAGLRFGTEVWRKAETKNVDTGALRTAERVLTASIARIYPKFVSTVPGQGSIDFAGGQRSISFLSTASATGHILRNRIEAVSDGHGLALGIATVPELARGNAGATTQALLRRLASVEFGYYGTVRGTKGPAWYKIWQGQPVPPDLIRIRVTFASHGAAHWPELILQPRIAADASCIYDALTKFCVGRG